MPHDRKNVEIKVGDTVRLVGKVASVQANPDYCNCSVSSPYQPPGQMGFNVTLCTQEVEKIDTDEDALNRLRSLFASAPSVESHDDFLRMIISAVRGG